MTTEELISKYETIIAHMYQIAGAYNMPEDILDILCDPEQATQEQIDAMLPHMPKAIYQVQSLDSSNWVDVSAARFNETNGPRRAVLDLDWPDNVPVKE